MQIFLAIINIIPSLIKIIAAIEEAFPQAGIGGEKLELVKKILTTAYESVTEYWDYLEKIISFVVEFANKIGAFTKSTKTE
jgi:phage-related protein